MTKTSQRKIALIGKGAIGQCVFKSLKSELCPDGQFAFLVRETEVEGVGDKGLVVFTRTQQLIDWKPNLAIECAGHEGVRAHAPELLRNGIDVVIISVGALGDADLRKELENASQQGGGEILLVSGAIGGLDALQSARMAGLKSVRYVGRKAPMSWSGTPASETHDLKRITTPTVIFEGTAAESARLYPKNANVTAAVALAGLGFDETQVQLIADPAADKNIHELEVAGDFGSFTIRLENNPLPSNPKTSWLAALSIEATLSKYFKPQSI